MITFVISLKPFDISSWNTSVILQEDLDDIENILANFYNHPSIFENSK